MPDQVLETRRGKLRIETWRPELLPPAAELALGLALEGASHGEFVALAGMRAYLKAGPLRGTARWRHGLRRALGIARVPRMQEYFNLCWLHNRHFQTPLPLAAGVLSRGGLPRYQFLLTQEVRDARPFEQALPEESPSRRAALLRELGSEVARMHALGFVHHDLYPRNLLVLAPDWPRRIVFHDAWAGGDVFHLRRPSYDLACLLLEGADLFGDEEQRALLSAYFEGRRSQGRPVGARLLGRVRRERAALVRQLRRDPERLRGRPMPGPWPPSETFLSDLSTP